MITQLEPTLVRMFIYYKPVLVSSSNTTISMGYRLIVLWTRATTARMIMQRQWLSLTAAPSEWLSRLYVHNHVISHSHNAARGEIN